MKTMIFMLSVSLMATASAAAAQTGTGGQAALRATAEARLPVSPVERVIAEGRARGASAAQIDRAALAVHARLNASARALRSEQRPAPSHAEIEAGAEALAAGASTIDLQEIGGAAPSDRSLTASLTALAQLTAHGGDASHVAADLAGRLQAGAGDPATPSLAGSATGAVGLGGATGVTGSVVGSVGAGIIP